MTDDDELLIEEVASAYRPVPRDELRYPVAKSDGRRGATRSRAMPLSSTWCTIGKMKSLPGRPSLGVRASVS